MRSLCSFSWRSGLCSLRHSERWIERLSMRGPNRRRGRRWHSKSYGKEKNIILRWFIVRIIIISCVTNVVIQMSYDIYKFVSSFESKNCDLKVQGSIFWTEFLWSFSRLNSCIFWMIPFLYIFIPSNFFAKLCDKHHNNEDD